MTSTDTQTLVNIVEDLVEELLWSGRKEDEDMPRGKIEEMVLSGEVTKDFILQTFKVELYRRLTGGSR